VRVLWVTAEPPDRSAGGGSIRIANLIERVAGHCEVDLLMTGALRDPAVAAAVRDVVEVPAPAEPRARGPVAGKVRSVIEAEILRQPSPVAATAAHRRTLAPWIADRAWAYDVVHVDHDRLAGLLPQQRGQPWIITLHNLVSEQMRHRLATEPGSALKRWNLRRACAVAARFETAVIQDFDRVCVTSPDDATALGGAAVVPNGVDLERFQVTPLPTVPVVTFTGRLDWGPNVEGIAWFCSEVLPLIRSHEPDVTVRIVGRNPVPAARRLAGPGVDVVADAPDIRPHLQAARVCVVPLTVGSGTRLKALEAMASGRPVVGTSIGMAGLGIISGREAEIADGAQEMAEACLRLLHDDKHAADLAATGRALVENQFGWDRIAARFVEVLQTTVDGFAHAAE
jgi:glycosyltransferase involved in cell wall biosynthesis